MALIQETINAKDFLVKTTSMTQLLTLEVAILLIQTNERGRQGKRQALNIRNLNLEAKKTAVFMNQEETKEIATTAVIIIQKNYRGFRDRKRYSKALQDERIFLGMEAPRKEFSDGGNDFDGGRRKLLQNQYEEEYQKALITTKEKIHRIEGPSMIESLQDDFRQWYMEHKRVAGTFPDFPDDDIFLAAGFKFTGLPSKSAKESIYVEVKADDLKKGDKPGTPKKADKKGNDQLVVEDLNAFKFEESDNILRMKAHLEEYRIKWQTRDEGDNFAQRHDQEIIKAEKRKEVENEVKSFVDHR